jgi:hypothetical protein
VCAGTGSSPDRDLRSPDQARRANERHQRGPPSSDLSYRIPIMQIPKTRLATIYSESDECAH